ncbi:hypothetical protein SKAU_G00059010 [Synaphobranchus kaupii]|uniref:Integrase catalytic domain-containing protein n=1 Tax=Synaphobranchus kaupii TaxID=118154 RepID=A0A9Q1G5C6_SYNKA|nr:hypothetical protein SKAU_G00059010 [Synaphobranchus kaupii]
MSNAAIEGAAVVQRDITDQDLRNQVSDFLNQCPNSGYKIVSGFLRSTGIRVQRSRVRKTMRAVDPIGTLFRGLELNVVHRRTYSAPAPLSLWHIDGNHKLIRWRIVIHGCIDGYSRKIMYLLGSTNNRASTVLENFLGVVQQFGLPSCVRSDKGGENVGVAKFMMEHPLRGPVTEAFNELLQMQADVSELSKSLLERFVVLMYDRTSETTEVNEARKQLFTQKSRALDNMPPTKAALEQHIKRATYQANV